MKVFIDSIRNDSVIISVERQDTSVFKMTMTEEQYQLLTTNWLSKRFWLGPASPERFEEAINKSQSPGRFLQPVCFVPTENGVAMLIEGIAQSNPIPYKVLSDAFKTKVLVVEL